VNDNDILHRFFGSNDYSKKQVHETISPSMDISVASNFERLVYDFFLDRNASKCAELFNNFPSQGIELDETTWSKKNKLFNSASVNDAATQEIIHSIFQHHHYLLDPHTAVAMQEAMVSASDKDHFVVLATAHPAKFPDVYKKLDIDLTETPTALRGLFEKTEQLHHFDSNYDQITSFISSHN